MTALQDLKAEINSGVDPFSVAQRRFEDAGYPHTHIHIDLVSTILKFVRPVLWLEVGSMIGGSAIKTAEAIKLAKAETQIVCIDPFCGDVNMWAWEKDLAREKKWKFLNLEHGRPTIYDRFLANIAAAGHTDIILPLATTSLVGIKLLKRLFAEKRLFTLPEVIYLDSAHEPDETLLELRNSWSLLKPGGVLWGDDWGWDAVRNDVSKFAQEIGSNERLHRCIADAHPESSTQGNIILYKGHWLLAK